jgi:hypothetical protein
MIVMDYYPCNIWWNAILYLIRWRFKQIFGRTKIKRGLYQIGKVDFEATEIISLGFEVLA